MKVLMVSDCGSIHTERWALSLADAGIDVVLFSITPGNPGIYAEKGIKLQVFDLFRYKKKKNGSLKGAIFSFFEALSAHCRAVRSLKRLIAAEKPDLLHAHYATSYGLVAALSGFHPLMVSVWGSDVYEFPRLSALNRMAVRFILGKADRVLSTSHAMAEEASRYCRKDIGITPFGVDTDLFRPAADSAGKDATVVFATVKTMSSRYGIDLLIKAYAQMRRKLHFGNPLQAVPDTLLRIAGDGPDLAMLRRLAEDEGVAPFKDIEEVQNECILYNGMLAPVVGYGIRGCLWYQGEANIDYPDLYTRLLPAMVADWRQKWGQGEFPFYYAQIAPYNSGKGEGKGKNSAYLREAQTKCLDLIPNSGMAILTDIGYPNTIHPMKKEEVGDRFAYLALGLTYGMKGFPVTGPMFQEMKIEGKEATITFKSTGRGVTSYRQDIKGFEVADADRVFHPAKARISNDPKKVIVWSDKVAQPVAVRFCFKDYTDCNLFNYAGLPASSFRTDNWDDK